jgi:uncharacterized membrane protein YuzA (DUF378 family)
MKCTEKCSKMQKFMKLLVTIGALNWGLVGLGSLFGLENLNIVNLLLGGMGWLEKLVYLLVVLSALMLLKKCAGKYNKSGV